MKKMITSTISLFLVFVIICTFSACTEKTKESSTVRQEIVSIPPEDTVESQVLVEKTTDFTDPLNIDGIAYLNISVKEYVDLLSSVNEDAPTECNKLSDEFYISDAKDGLIISMIADGSENGDCIRSVRIVYDLSDENTPEDYNAKLIQLCIDSVAFLDDSADVTDIETMMKSGYFFINDICIMTTLEDNLTGFLLMSAFSDMT